LKAKKWLILCILTFVSFLLLLPLWLLLSGSLMGGAEAAQNFAPVLEDAAGNALWPILPKFPTLQPLIKLLLDSPEFFKMFWNSCAQVFPLVAGQVLLGAPAAWAFARYEFKGKKALFLLYIVLMLMPFQVTMVSSYLVLDSLHLMGTIWSVILPGAASTFPVFIMTRFFAAIPASLTEAAALDGAGPLKVFLQVGLPMGAPGILSAVVLGFFEYWNALEVPLTFLKHNPEHWPLSLYLPSISANNLGISLMASVVMLTPALLIFLFGQKYLEQGICASGLKDN
jgi:multiple sugar transport system permease protein